MHKPLGCNSGRIERVKIAVYPDYCYDSRDATQEELKGRLPRPRGSPDAGEKDATQEELKVQAWKAKTMIRLLTMMQLRKN